MKDYSNMALRYFRGSIWKYKDDTSVQYKGVQSGDRHALIVSDNQGNYTNDSVIVLFITSQKEKAEKSINVLFENYRGDYNVVLCNQIKTVSKNNLVEFMGVMTDSCMDSVEKAMTLSLGMDRPNADLSALEKAVNNIIVKFERQTILKQQQTDITQEQVNKIAEQLEEIFEDVVIPLNKNVQTAPLLTAFSTATKEETKGITADKKEVVVNKACELKETKIVAEKKERKPKGFWTYERKAEFLKDKDEMTLEEMRIKWGVSSNKIVYQMCYNFKAQAESGGSKSGGVDR